MDLETGSIAIYSRSNGRGNEELGSIGILSGVCHAEYTGLGVLQFEVLIIKLVAID